MNQKQNFFKGIVSENPILYSMLGLCPTLAITTKLENAIGMGIAVVFVLVLSNLVISLLRKIVPNEIRIPVFIVVIASFVTLVDMLMAAYAFELHGTLGIFIPLIVVNCIILGRAEAFASKNDPWSSVVDGFGMAIGYTIILMLIASIRELLGDGTLTLWGDIAFDINQLFGVEKLPIFTDFFTSPAGAYIVLGLIFGIIAAIKFSKKKVGDKK
ncbi:MAG: electron transport complex subunit E [Bacilli bacterium]|jgi:electron transport complex protein RnfE|nr:electron transport complex subunit E [Bacilli bacterium]